MHKIVWGAAAANDKTKEIELKKLEDMKAQADSITKQMKDISPDGGVGKVQKASLQRELNKLKGDAKKVAEWFKPKNQMAHLNEQAAQLEQVAQSLASDPDNSLMVQTYLQSAANKRAEAKLIQDDLDAQAKALAKANEGRDPKYMNEDTFIKGISRGYGSKDPMGQFMVDPKNKQKLRTMESIARSLDAEAGKDPAQRLDIQTEVRETTEELQHVYLTDVKNAARMSFKELTAEIKMLQDNGFLPKVPIKGNVAALKNRLNKGYFNVFQKDMRTFAGDPDLFVYKPHKDQAPETPIELRD
jgi:hypothetical protein